MTPPIPIVVLASGRGTGFEAIYRAIESKELNAEIKAVISDQPQAQVLARAGKYGIKALSIPVEGRRHDHEEKILRALESFHPRFLVLAGYMRILTPLLIEAFRSERGYTRMINIHPSLLPAFPGVHSYSQALEYGVKVTGVTVHLVEHEVDTGPICAQEAFSIGDCKSAHEVEARGLEVEHRLYPKTLSWVLPEDFSLETRKEGRLCVRAN